MIKFFCTIIVSIITMVSQAASPQGQLEWSGVVGGVFNSSKIGLLQIADDGTLVSQRTIVVEARAMEKGKTGTLSDAQYNGDIIWNLANISVSTPTNDINKLLLKVNGVNIVSGQGVETLVGQHILHITTAMQSEGIKEAMVYNRAVQVDAVIMAEPKI